MKFTFPAFALTALLLVATAGCGDKGSGGTSSGDATAVPATTTVDGKTVTLTATPSGLRYYDTKVGTGPSPQPGQSVSVQYTGTLLDGTKFDSTADHDNVPLSFNLGHGDVIKGWDEGVATMKVGGQRRLVIPGSLAYGDSPPPGTPITPNATLVFDVELVNVK